MLAGLLVTCLILGGCTNRSVQTANTLNFEETRQHYALLEDILLERGLLKTEEDHDSPGVSATQLARNFEQIAMYSEYTLKNGTYVEDRNVLKLRRWEVPVRIDIVFGQSVTFDQQRQHLNSIGRYVNKLQEITGHPMRLTRDNPNVLILVLSTEELNQARGMIRRFSDEIPSSVGRAIATMPLPVLCTAYTVTETKQSPMFVSAIVMLRTEHEGMMMEACIHEEIAQMLGLPNDSPTAYPSIFNDNEEFALLTRHDEMLLEILYDPRLQVGMSIEEVRPIARQIAREVVAGNTMAGPASGQETRSVLQ